MPVQEKMAIWKPAKKPKMPCGMKMAGSVTLCSEAVTPSGEVQPLNTIQAPVAISATIATTLIIANQNSGFAEHLDR